MKDLRLVSIFFFIAIFSCNKSSSELGDRTTICLLSVENEYPRNRGDVSLCSTEKCLSYQAIWKELFAEKNNLDQDFFDNHIKLHYSDLNDWAKGISFYVCYNVEIDWLIGYNCDKFITKIDSNITSYPHLDLPRGTDLTKEEIKLALDNRAFGARIIQMNNVTDLSHTSFTDAMNDLIEFSNVDTLCYNRLTINDGNWTLLGIAQYENEENSCIHGTIDLITGEKEVYDLPCSI